MLDFDLMDIKRSIEGKRKFDTTLQTEFNKAIQREKQLIAKNPENRENKRVLVMCQREVLQELPPNSFFVPDP